MRVSYADIAFSRVEVTLPEAIALVLAADESADKSAQDRQSAGGCAVPPLDDIWLNSTGQVYCSTSGPFVSQSERVRQLGELLTTLLWLDARSPFHSRVRPPAPVLLLLARATGEMDLPIPSAEMFREALARFQSTGAVSLAELYARTRGALAVDERPDAANSARFRSSGWRAAFQAALAAAVAVMWVVPPAHHPPPADAPGHTDRVTLSTTRLRFALEGSPSKSPGLQRSVGAGVPSALIARPLLTAAVVGNDVFSPAFAPHGNELLFHTGRDRSALMRAAFGGVDPPELTTLLRDGAANYHATLSPDGHWLAYDSDRDGTRAVYIARADASESRKVSGSGYAAVPRWSRDGRKLAFAKAEPGRSRVWNVWVADLDRDVLSRISNHRVGQAWSGSWFPDGKRIAYSIEDTLVVATLPGGRTRVYPSPRPGRLVRTPAVSPDGRWIAFQLHRDGIWLVDTSTGTMRRLLSDSAAEEFTWSPDGRRLVYHTRRDGTWSVWELALDGAIAG